MNTDLIDVLVKDLRPVKPVRRHSVVLVIVACLLAIAILGWATYGNRVIAQDPSLNFYSWLKLFPFALGILGFGILARDVAIPGRRAGLFPIASLLCAATATVAFIIAGIVTHSFTAIFSMTAIKCVTAIPLLALPGMVLLVGFMRRHAVTRPTTAGACLGATAGVCAALIYGMSCTVDHLAFVGVWYFVGVMIATAIGALIGNKVLRW